MVFSRGDDGAYSVSGRTVEEVGGNYGDPLAHRYGVWGGPRDADRRCPHGKLSAGLGGLDTHSSLKDVSVCASGGLLKCPSSTQ